MRSWLFRSYGWLATLATLAAIAWAAYSGAWLPVLAPAGPAILGFCYFVQQQKLAETALFERLFTSFNKRYDEMNDRLADIVEDRMTSVENRKIVVDYFNLCAEEYLFFKAGYIYPDVWTSWCRGMLWYLRRHPFKDIWGAEMKEQSFYGLSLEAITKGARLDKH